MTQNIQRRDFLKAGTAVAVKVGAGPELQEQIGPFVELALIVAAGAAGFHAVTMWRRESGFWRSDATSFSIWSMVPPFGSGHERHW